MASTTTRAPTVAEVLATDRFIREILGGIALRRGRQITGNPNDKEE